MKWNDNYSHALHNRQFDILLGLAFSDNYQLGQNLLVFFGLELSIALIAREQLRTFLVDMLFVIFLAVASFAAFLAQEWFLARMRFFYVKYLKGETIKVKVPYYSFGVVFSLTAPAQMP